jgi:hypothetical protein
MYKDPLLTPEQNEHNRHRLQSSLENSAIKLVNPAPNKSDDQFCADLLNHCQGLRAMESYEVKNNRKVSNTPTLKGGFPQR